jgi:pimeloyl-[acyl-carrier protein] methyl ester esterase|tara:strand:+ start:114 stop:878 length:765 start_codon:yes stop_codon:yes gene_type:complete
MSSTQDSAELVLLHGWGTHAGVWAQVENELKSQHSFESMALDFPGYGTQANRSFTADIDVLAHDALERSPETAVWGGWSLGGMVALRAATIAPERVRGLILVSSTPKFVASADWSAGAQIDFFETFVKSLTKDYGRNLRRFLLLQAGDSKGARQLSAVIKEIIEAAPQPSAETLNSGLDLLKNLDMRDQLGQMNIPINILSGRMDRICHPDASKWLADRLGGRLTQLESGHGSLLSHPRALADELSRLLYEVVS